MTNIQHILRLQGGASHSATIALPQPTRRGWKRTWALLRSGGEHSLGTHTYSYLVGPDTYYLAIRWSNGAVTKQGTGFCGRVYFDELAVDPPPTHRIVTMPRANQRIDASTGSLLVAHGAGHVFRPRGQLSRRMLLVPVSMSQAEVDALVVTYLRFRGVKLKAAGSEWGPARERLPIINRAHYGNVFGSAVSQLSAQVASGVYGTGSHRIYGPNNWVMSDLTGTFGPYILDGDKQPGAAAGYEIDPSVLGWAQTPEALEFAAIQHECSTARNPIAWYDMNTGEPMSCHDWATTEHGRPQTMAGGALELPCFAGPNKPYPNYNSGSSSYQIPYESYRGDDLEHYIRQMDDGAHLAFTAGDAMAQDDLRMGFEHHRAFTFNDRSDAMQVSWPGYTSLTKDLVIFAASPGRGSGRFLRQWGWMLNLAVYNRETAFCRKMIECFLLAVDSLGIVERRTHSEMPDGVQGTQIFHNHLDQGALLRAARLVDDQILTGRVLDAISDWRDGVVKKWPIRKWLARVRQDGSYVDPINVGDWFGGGFTEHALAVIGLAAMTARDDGDAAEAKEYLNAGLKITNRQTLAAELAAQNSMTGDLSQVASYKAAIDAL